MKLNLTNISEANLLELTKALEMIQREVNHRNQQVAELKNSVMDTIQRIMLLSGDSTIVGEILNQIKETSAECEDSGLVVPELDEKEQSEDCAGEEPTQEISPVEDVVGDTTGEQENQVINNDDCTDNSTGENVLINPEDNEKVPEGKSPSLPDTEKGDIANKSTLSYIKGKGPGLRSYNLTPEQESSFKIHLIDLCLTDEKTGYMSHGRGIPVITPKGTRLKKVIDKFTFDVLKENGGYFEGFIPNPEWTEGSEMCEVMRTEKSAQMAREVRDRILRHNDELLGVIEQEV